MSFRANSYQQLSLTDTYNGLTSREQKALEHYCDPNDYNKTFYYNNDSDTDNQLKAILEDADATFRAKAGKETMILPQKRTSD